MTLIANHRKIIGIILLSLSLSACFSSAVTGASLVYDRYGLQKSAENQYISHQSNMMLETDKQLASTSHTSAAAFDYVVLLVGQTPTQALKNRAQHLVSGIPGVRKIYNEITIGTPIPQYARMHDAWLTTKIRTRMVATNGFDPANVKVVTENSVVYLMGVLTHSQARIAIAIAQHTSGVRKVVKVFEYWTRTAT